MMLYAKIDTIFFFFEGLVKVIVNIIRNIVSFDNLKISRTVSFLKVKAKLRKKSLTKLKSS
jgi:hypothetical protein